MTQVQVRFLGSGDAFGSRGRLQTCFLLEGENAPVLIDCGASALIAMKRESINPSEISWIVLSHLHGDHFGGIPFLILDGQFSRRTQPLTIVGPPGVQTRVQAAMEVFFPGSSQIQQRFSVEFIELEERVATVVGPATVTPFLVQHACGAPPYALRVDYGNKVIAYSGDTEWSESLIEVARGADLFICEAYFFEKRVKYHLDYRTLRAHRNQLKCKWLILTHMNEDMLDRTIEVEEDRAEDGLTLVL